MGKSKKKQQIPIDLGVAPIDNRELFSRFLKLIWPYRWLIIPAVICTALMSTTNGARSRIEP